MGLQKGMDIDIGDADVEDRVALVVWAAADAARDSGAVGGRVAVDEAVVAGLGDCSGDRAAGVELPSEEVGVVAAELGRIPSGDLEVHDGVPLSVELPPKATLEVIETEPTMKGQTASSSYKPAVLSNGVRTMVPPFVTPGTKIVVMTADGSYVERAKD